MKDGYPFQQMGLGQSENDPPTKGYTLRKKINSKWMMNLALKYKITKLLRKTYRRNS